MPVNRKPSVAPQEAVKEAPKKDVKTAVGTSGSVPIKDLGAAVVASMSKEEVLKMGAESGNIAFLSIINNPADPVTRKGKADGSRTVGARLKNVGDKAINVPVIPYVTNKVTVGDFENASLTTVNPGEEFLVNTIELAALACRDEYASEFKGDLEGSGLHVRFSYVSSKKNPDRLPTIQPRLVGEGAVKDHADSICDAETKTIFPEYAEKFGILLTRPESHSGGAKASNTARIEASKGIQELFNRRLGGK